VTFIQRFRLNINGKVVSIKKNVEYEKFENCIGLKITSTFTGEVEVIMQKGQQFELITVARFESNKIDFEKSLVLKDKVSPFVKVETNQLSSKSPLNTTLESYEVYNNS